MFRLVSVLVCVSCLLHWIWDRVGWIVKFVWLALFDHADVGIAFKPIHNALSVWYKWDRHTALNLRSQLYTHSTRSLSWIVKHRPVGTCPIAHANPMCMHQGASRSGWREYSPTPTSPHGVADMGYACTNDLTPASDYVNRCRVLVFDCTQNIINSWLLSNCTQHPSELIRILVQFKASN